VEAGSQELPSLSLSPERLLWAGGGGGQGEDLSEALHAGEDWYARRLSGTGCCVTSPPCVLVHSLRSGQDPYVERLGEGYK
jgi:hypothetical protein